MPLLGNLFASHPPDDLGLVDGRLRPPPATPNCAHSQVDPGHRGHVEPLPGSWDEVLDAVAAHDEVTFVTRADDYAHAEAQTPVMGFVDDLEFQPRDDGSVDVRSASRLGKGDMDKNRNRLDEIRASL